jgi:hypothetical protein
VKRIVAIVLVALAVPAAGGARVGTAGVTLDEGTVHATWRQGWLQPGAAVVFKGSVDMPSTLTAILRPAAHRGTVTAKKTFDVPQAGAFTGTMPLPPRPLPGRYTLRIVRSDAPGAAKVVVEVPAPPEGVLDRALVGPSMTGPWQGYNVNSAPVFHGSNDELWMRFHFLSAPTSNTVELVWKYRWHIVIGKVYKRYKHVLLTYAKSGTPLAHGTWVVTLRIGGRIAKQMDVVLR